MITLETAKELKLQMNTYWCYAKVKEEYQLMETNRACDNGYDYFPAPSLEELLERMPDELQLNKIKAGQSKKNYYRITLRKFGKIFMFKHPNPSEAVAKLYIKLRKEGLIK